MAMYDNVRQNVRRIFYCYCIAYRTVIIHCNALQLPFDATELQPIKHPAGLVDQRTRRSTQHAVAGSQVVIRCCSPHSPSVIWVFESNGVEVEMITNGRIQPGYEKKLQLDRSVRECHNLVIYNVTVADSGVYRCIDDDSDAVHTHVTFLTVQGKTGFRFVCNANDRPTEENSNGAKNDAKYDDHTRQTTILIIVAICLGILVVALMVALVVAFIVVLLVNPSVRSSVQQACSCFTHCVSPTRDSNELQPSEGVKSGERNMANEQSEFINSSQEESSNEVSSTDDRRNEESIGMNSD